MQTPIAEPPSRVGQRAQLLAKRSVIVPRGTVTHALAISIDDTARPPCAHPMTGLEMSDSFALGCGRQNFLPRGPSAQSGRASHRPANVSVSRSRFRAPSSGGHRTLPHCHTSTSSCRSPLPTAVPPGEVGGLRARLGLLQHTDDLPFCKHRSLQIVRPSHGAGH